MGNPQRALTYSMVETQDAACRATPLKANRRSSHVPEGCVLSFIFDRLVKGEGQELTSGMISIFS